MWCTTCRQVNALGGAPLKLTGWRGLWIAVQAVGAWGSVWAEEVAERCLTGKGAGGKNLQRPEDVEAVKRRGGTKSMCTRTVQLFVQKYQGQRQQGGFEELERGAPGGGAGEAGVGRGVGFASRGGLRRVM